MNQPAQNAPSTFETVEVDGVKYPISTLTTQEQEMITLHARFTADVIEARVVLTQFELARELLGSKIANSIKASQLAIAAAAQEVASTPEATTEPTSRSE